MTLFENPPHDFLCDKFDKKEEKEFVDCNYCGLKIPLSDCKETQKNAKVLCVGCEHLKK